MKYANNIARHETHIYKETDGAWVRVLCRPTSGGIDKREDSVSITNAPRFPICNRCQRKAERLGMLAA